MVGIERPAEWDSVIVKFAETSRNSYNEWRKACPNQDVAKQLLMQFADNSKFEKCTAQGDYIASMGLKENKQNEK